MIESVAVPAASFWQGRRVLVTGDTGFKGSWLALWLHELGAVVSGLADGVPTTPSHYESIHLGDCINHVQVDVRDSDALARALEQLEPEIVFHLAAQSLVYDGYEDPLRTYHVNVTGTANLLEAVRSLTSIRVVIVATSDKCYRNEGDGRAFTETDPLGGTDPYSSSKACAELVADAFRSSFFEKTECTLATVRAGNVIGGGDWGPRRLIPDAVRAINSGVPLEVRSPDAIRPWQDVFDCLRGYILLAEKAWDNGRFGGPWNFGPQIGQTRDVRWMLSSLAEHWVGFRWELTPTPSFKEAAVLVVDPTKAREQLGWVPLRPLNKSVQALAEWYAAYGEGEDMRAVSRSQLLEYSRVSQTNP